MFCDDPLWTLECNTFEPEHEKHAEALCTTGNGYLGCRGAFAEAFSGEHHYPGTYIAGVYNRLVSRVADRDIENEDFVNCPDWTQITFRTPGGAWFDTAAGEILAFRRQLNLVAGLLLREIRLKHPTGEITTIRSARFVSMAREHCAGIRYTIVPENYAGRIIVCSGLNGDIENEGVKRYAQLNQLHLARDFEDHDGDTLILGVRTTQSQIAIAERAAHAFTLDGDPVAPEREVMHRPRLAAAEFTVAVAEGEELTLEKTVAICTSRDAGVDDPAAAARKELDGAPPLTALIDEHREAWREIWDRIDVRVEGDEHTQRVIRLHAYHLVTTASPFNEHIDAAMPARGLHGEAYRGHIFWDELFAFPFYNIHFPAVARAFLMYRYRRLDQARAYAREYGYRGAMFPWQSGSDGREETQIYHLNPVSGEWGPDHSSLQRHISLAVAYNTWTYCRVTGDRAFLAAYGAEVLLDIAAFWASACTYNEETGRYEIHRVMGPNEFHETMPRDGEHGGLKDNAYTNVMAAWTLERALETLDALDDDDVARLREKLALNDETLARWRDITGKLNVAVRDGIIAQYDGFLDLKELDWDHYREQYGNIGRLDRILKAEGRSPDHYQLTKQGDLTMLFYVLPIEVIKSLFADLGLAFSDDMLRKNYDYYLRRTSHGSTLSLVVHSRVAAMLGDMDTSLEWYRKSLEADLHDIQGGTTKEGIHAGLMAGTVTALLSSYAGLDPWKDPVSLTPNLPADWDRLAFTFQVRGTRYAVAIERSAVKIRAASPAAAAVTVNGRTHELPRGEEVEISL